MPCIALPTKPAVTCLPLCDAVRQGVSVVPCVRFSVRHVRNLLLADYERELLESTTDLFAKVSQSKESWISACCTTGTLRKAEVMLLLEALREKKHVEVQYAGLLDKFGDEISKVRGRDAKACADGITADEMSAALVTAMTLYMSTANARLATAVASKYEKMEDDLRGSLLPSE